MAEKPKRRGRNSLLRRDEILTAAQQVFSRRGYSQAGVREIAEAAGGMSSSLLIHHFGTKAEIFRAALVDLLGKSPVPSFDHEHFGELLTAFSVHNPDGPTLGKMMALSLGDDEARAVTTEFAERYIKGFLAETIGGEDAEANAFIIMVISLGLGMVGRELSLGTLPEKTLAWAARQIQMMVDEDRNAD